MSAIVKWGKQWWLTFEAFDDIDRDILTEQFSRIIKDDSAEQGYTATEEPVVFFKDSRVDAVFPGDDLGLICVYATIRGYEGKHDPL